MKKTINQEVQDQKTRSVFLVLTGPTASGKDTVFAKLKEKDPDLMHIITTTSRQIRPGESEGNPYYFIPRDEFENKIASHEFFEWVEFRGNLYGTQKKTLDESLNSGKDVIWHIEAKGVKNIYSKIKEMSPRSIFVYLSVSDINTLEERVRKDEKGIKTERWNPSLAQWEMEQYDDCDYLVVNDDGDLEKSVNKVLSIMEAKRLEIIK